jgi:tyrosine decarboxylase
MFIGDKAENAEFYKKNLNKMAEDHMGWRVNYMPGDMAAITEEDKKAPDFVEAKEHMKEVFDELSRRMRSGAIPWHTAGRYLGQMNAETLMPSLLAYNYAMLWNSNNTALESSMATSDMEAEVGQDFANLFSFPEGWGHLTHDGSVANLEGIWYARCVKSIPLAMAEVLPDNPAVKGKSEWELLNMSVEDILAALEPLTSDQMDAVKAASSRSGRNIQKLGKWLVPMTKHYSWEKAADISGVGLDNMVEIPVDSAYRMDVAKLEATIREYAEKKIPILGVVAVVGTTEEGAVDHVDQIQALREKLQKEGIYFYLHVDAAYGGYARTLFIDEDGKFVDYKDLNALFEKHDIFHYPVTISEDVYNGYKAIQYADSVTVDPHKMGYVPYSAGGFVLRYKAMRNIISYFAPYVFEKGVQAPDLLGAFIIAGSKAGATAAAVWTAHQCLPLNITGYGALCATTIEAAQRFRKYLQGRTFQVGDKTIEVHPLNDPDFNLVDWVYKEKGNTDLAAMNDLNEKMYDYTSYMIGDVYSNKFISSHTTFDQDGYGDSPLPFIESMGIPKAEWDKVKSVTVMRAAIMTPYLNDDKVFDYYMKAVTEAMQTKLEEIYQAQ